MPELIEMTNGEVLDLDEADGQYRYLANELCRFGASSTTLSVLTRLYRKAVDTAADVTIPSRFVANVTVEDPDSHAEVELEIRKLDTGAMVGIDGSFLESDVGPVYSPYDCGVEVEIPDTEG